MTLPLSYKDREQQKFVECPESEVAVRVKVCNPEDISITPQKGETASSGETISAIKALYSNGVSVFLGDPNGSFQDASIIGISITASTIGNEIRYLIDGILFDSSLSFTNGEPVFLDIDGGLTQVDPAILGHTYRVLLGYATGTNAININIQEPIQIN